MQQIIVNDFCFFDLRIYYLFRFFFANEIISYKMKYIFFYDTKKRIKQQQQQQNI